ncbi:MAG: L-ribulose-5-phosphate 4-epimerase [Kiritimatiellaeota bacterium]|nr:L-ribulose-5-phosphate 4-epimerase [Kiritimatiellota bacterium]
MNKLKQAVWQANLALVDHGLVVLTWGNVSAVDRKRGVIVIKPSGVAYDAMRPEDMVVTDLDGTVVEGKLRPSSDLPTHVALYRAWKEIGGVVHTHSMYATSFAQACRGIPCLGTTHADHFYGEVPCTRVLRRAEVEKDYEANTGKVIVERLAGTLALQMPAAVVANHGPFAWGKDAADAVHNAVALEQVAQMAINARQINPAVKAIPAYILDKHYLRKHGATAYYGQK